MNLLQTQRILLRYFNGVIYLNQKQNLQNLQKLLMKGFYVDTSCTDSETTEAILAEFSNSYNTTFYKSIQDVLDRNRFELFLDQIRSYQSSYGTDFNGEYFTQNPYVESFSKNVKTIKVLTLEEVRKNLYGLLGSGVALSTVTLNDVFSLFNELLKEKIDISKVKNKEALATICVSQGVYPNDANECVRIINYIANGGNISLIKNRDNYSKILVNKKDMSTILNSIGLHKLSTVFNRHKNIFMFIKRANNGNISVINKISKLSKVYHVPYKKTLIEGLFSNENVDFGKLYDFLMKGNSFSKVKLLNALSKKDGEYKPYFIRNGKVFLKKVEGKESTISNKKALYDTIYKSLIDTLSAKKCKVKLPKGIKVALPTSEKNFIGNIPMYSYVSLDTDYSMVGIEWNDESGYKDLDLSSANIDGRILSWCNAFSDGRATYSGDMTRTVNGKATELFRCSGKYSGSFRVNIYAESDINNSDKLITVFLGKSPNLSENNMIEPSDVVFQTKIKIEDATYLGFLVEGDYVFCQPKSVKGRVATYSVTDKLLAYIIENRKNNIYLDDVLRDAGFEIVEEGFDLDLSELSKNNLIDLLS